MTVEQPEYSGTEVTRSRIAEGKCPKCLAHSGIEFGAEPNIDTVVIYVRCPSCGTQMYHRENFLEVGEEQEDTNPFADERDV